MSPQRNGGEMDGPAPETRPEPEGRRNAEGIRVDPDVEAEPEPREAVISVLVDHEPGVLSEVAGLFSRRRFNIESLAVGPTADEDTARITVVCEEPDPGVDQVEKQLRKLREVRSVRELPGDAARRELALVKVDATSPADVRAVADMYDGTVVDAGQETITVEVTAQRDRIDAAVEAFERFGVREVARTGPVALVRGGARTAADAVTTRRGDTGERHDVAGERNGGNDDTSRRSEASSDEENSTTAGDEEVPASRTEATADD